MQKELDLPLLVNLEIPALEDLDSPETQSQANELERYFHNANVQKLQAVVLHCLLQKTTPVFNRYNHFNGKKYSPICEIPVNQYSRAVCVEVVNRFKEKGYDIYLTDIGGSQMNYEGRIIHLKLKGVTFKNDPTTI